MPSRGGDGAERATPVRSCSKRHTASRGNIVNIPGLRTPSPTPYQAPEDALQARARRTGLGRTGSRRRSSYPRRVRRIRRNWRDSDRSTRPVGEGRGGYLPPADAEPRSPRSTGTGTSRALSSSSRVVGQALPGDGCRSTLRLPGLPRGSVETSGEGIARATEQGSLPPPQSPGKEALDTAPRAPCRPRRYIKPSSRTWPPNL